MGGQWIGLISALYKDPRKFSEADVRRLMALARQSAVIVQNLKNIEFAKRQTDEALANREETELLYNIGSWLNAANTLEEVLKAACIPAIASSAESTRLFLIDIDDQGTPVFIKLMAQWQTQESPAPTLPIGTRFDLDEFPATEIWIANPQLPTLIDDVAQDERLDENTKAILLNFNVQRTAFIPLTLGGRWVGIITINWPTPFKFTEQDQRTYRAIISQTAVVVNNLN